MRRMDKSEYTEFSGQPIRLFCGDYYADDNGVAYKRGKTDVDVISHPLTITRRFINIETGEAKIEIAYRRKKTWRRL